MDTRLRMRMFAFVVLALFGGLMARLWYLQGIESTREEFQERALTNVLEPVYEEAPRGRILDRNGRVLVDNKVVQVVAIDRAVVEDLDPAVREAMFLRLAIAVSRSGRLVKLDAVLAEFDDRSYGPFERIPVAADVNPELLVFLGERADEFPGVNVVQETVRSYPFGSLAAHLLGYVGPITRDEWEAARAAGEAADARQYQLNHEIGKTGVERIFEDELRGVPGTRWLEINASNRVVRELDDRYVAPVPGNDVWLSIDIDLQQLAEAELSAGLLRARLRGAEEGEPPIVAPAGSVVMIDPAMRADERGVITTTPHYNPLLLRDSKADVMGIGVMLYEILTGVLPFDEVPWQYAGREQGGEIERLSLSYFLSYPPPKDLNPNTPDALARIVYRCLTVPEYGLGELEEDLVDFLRKD